MPRTPFKTTRDARRTDGHSTSKSGTAFEQLQRRAAREGGVGASGVRARARGAARGACALRFRKAHTIIAAGSHSGPTRSAHKSNLVGHLSCNGPRYLALPSGAGCFPAGGLSGSFSPCGTRGPRRTRAFSPGINYTGARLAPIAAQDARTLELRAPNSEILLCEPSKVHTPGLFNKSQFAGQKESGARAAAAPALGGRFRAHRATRRVVCCLRQRRKPPS